MNTELKNIDLDESIKKWLLEDNFYSNLTYINKFPKKIVELELKIKDDLVLSGLPYFCHVFSILGFRPEIKISDYEGEFYNKNDMKSISFPLPAHIAISGERLALNLLQKSSSISTITRKFKTIIENSNIELLDTRKTTPGLRTLEKYAVNIGGGSNHRFMQNDVWMIKDNHKKIFGGVKGAVDYFRSLRSFYTPIVCEIHSIEELEEAGSLKVNHFLLDNFTPKEVNNAIKIKKDSYTYEVSGGITIENIKEYLISGVDAISTSAITQSCPPVDLSLKVK